MADTFSELPPDELDEMLSRFADALAAEREHSAVDGDVRRCLAQIMQEERAAIVADSRDDRVAVPEERFVDRVMREFSPNDLRGIVTDWLRLQFV